MLILFVFIGLSAFSQDIDTKDYMEKMGYHKDSEEGRELFRLATQSRKNRGYHYYNGMYFTVFNNEIDKIIFLEADWYPYNLETGMKLDLAVSKLETMGGVMDNGYIVMENKYRIGFNEVNVVKDEVGDIVVKLTSEERARRKARQKLSFDGLIFSDEQAYDCYVRNKDNEAFVYLSGNGKCENGNCKNGTGTMVYESGIRFTGEWKEGVASRGILEMESGLLGKCKIDIDLIYGIPDGTGEMTYGDQKSGRIAFKCGIPDQVFDIDFSEYIYSGNIKPDISPTGLGTYQFNDGKRIDIQRNDLTGRLYGTIDFGNGMVYTGYLNGNMQMEGKGRLRLNAYEAVIESDFLNGGLAEPGKTELIYDNGFRQVGLFDLKTGFNGKVQTYIETFSGKYIVSGDFEKMLAIGRHELKEAFSGKLLGIGEYDKDGKLIEGADIYYGEENSLMYFKNESEEYFKEYGHQLDELFHSLRLEKKQVVTHFHVDMKHRQYIFYKDALFLEPENTYSLIVFDPSGKTKSYEITATRAAKELGVFSLSEDQKDKTLYVSDQSMYIPEKEEGGRPGANTIVLRIGAVEIKNGKHFFHVLIIKEPK